HESDWMRHVRERQEKRQSNGRTHARLLQDDDGLAQGEKRAREAEHERRQTQPEWARKGERTGEESGQTWRDLEPLGQAPDREQEGEKANDERDAERLIRGEDGRPNAIEHSIQGVPEDEIGLDSKVVGDFARVKRALLREHPYLLRVVLERQVGN